MKNYLIIILFTILPSIILFVSNSNIKDVREAAIFLFISGVGLIFLFYRKDKDERVMKFINDFF
ncbi:hypothetical protein [Arcobacter vandammei]|uniref:hypothetical protein n=1 Tax=Arcobacter vandammei TaxID=2782243 RepID=UPI0018DFD110|nr:hypothetical protein [Arcobacter vandammei]